MLTRDWKVPTNSMKIEPPHYVSIWVNKEHKKKIENHNLLSKNTDISRDTLVLCVGWPLREPYSWTRSVWELWLAWLYWSWTLRRRTPSRTASNYCPKPTPSTPLIPWSSTTSPTISSTRRWNNKFSSYKIWTWSGHEILLPLNC